MLVVSVARQLGSRNSFARLLCCPAHAERGGKRRSGSAKLTMPSSLLVLSSGLAVLAGCRGFRRARNIAAQLGEALRDQFRSVPYIDFANAIGSRKASCDTAYCAAVRDRA
jgi:hypothetical protein